MSQSESHEKPDPTTTLSALNQAQKTSDKEKMADAHAKKRVEEWLQVNRERVQHWLIHHPNERMPVYYIEEEDRVVWLNRNQRKRLLQNKKQGLSRPLNHTNRAPIPRKNR